MLSGPLDTSYCLLFYILSVGSLFICFCLFILLILNLKIFKKTKEIYYLLILFFILFIENRLLYSMCLNNTTTESFLEITDQFGKKFLSNSAQFDQKKKGLTDLGVRGNTATNLYNMLAVIVPTLIETLMLLVVVVANTPTLTVSLGEPTATCSPPKLELKAKP